MQRKKSIKVKELHSEKLKINSRSNFYYSMEMEFALRVRLPNDFRLWVLFIVFVRVYYRVE